MGIADKAKHVVEEITGKIKEELGSYTGNPFITAEGEAEVDAAKEEIAHDGTEHGGTEHGGTGHGGTGHTGTGHTGTGAGDPEHG
jgi:uncharacterized protein YjbJ (UPF0337 family)